MEHRHGEERKRRAKDASYRTVNSHRAVRNVCIAVHNVCEALDEEQIHAAADQATGDNLAGPRDGGARGPGEPEHASRD